jgi:polyisoprenoid-binding protein YceI
MGKRSLWLVLCIFSVKSWATRFDMRDLGQRNLVLISSEGLVERTIAISHFISGWVEVNPESPDSINGEFEMDVRTLDSGSELKNMQIKEQLLSAQEFPIAKVSCNSEIGKEKTKVSDGKPLSVKVNCDFKIKNTSKSIPVSIKLTYFKENEETRQRLTGNLLKLSASWDLDLASFGISIPAKSSALFAKWVQVSADMVGTDRLPNNALSLPEGIKKK